MGIGKVLVAGLVGVIAQAGAAGAQAAPACAAGEIAVAAGCVRLDAARREIDGIVRAAMPAKAIKASLAGISVAGGAPVLMAWGESMTGVPATPDMQFRNGSVAIAYIATVLLQLRDAGALTLDDRLARWFPDYPEADAVTLAMLIDGTSGYADYATDDGFLAEFHADPFRHWTPEALIAIGLGRPMVCDPGACWSYAHTNFVILGRVLEKIAGKPLDALIREGIIAPLQLTGTRSAGTARMPEPVLHAFDPERGTYEELTFWDSSWTLAEGAVMTSTVADILVSAEAIGEGRLVSPESHALQVAPATAEFEPWDERRYYGMGVFNIGGWVIQNPSFAGYAATMAYLPARKLAIVVSTTMQPEASLEGNLSTEVLREIAAYLAPEAPL